MSKEVAARQSQVIEACIIGTHAWQVKMYQASKKGDARAFDAQGLDAAALDALVAAHKKLAAADGAEVAKWVKGQPTKFDPADTITPLLNSGLKLDARLPVNVATEVFSAKDPAAPRVRVRAIASVLQLNLESDRDGDILQDLFRLYLAIGVLSGPSDFGYVDDNAAFAEAAGDFADKCCSAPIATDRANWQLSLRRVQNWNLKHRGIGPREYADELLARDDIRPLIPKIKAMKPQRILVLGHSYTMKVHWSTLAPMNEIVRAVFEKLNPNVAFTHMGHGGMRAYQARDKFLKDALAWKPDRVLIVVSMSGDQNLAAMEEMVRAFRGIGAEVMCFDRLQPGRGGALNPDDQLAALAEKTGLVVIEVGPLLNAHPQKSDFLALDGIHMTPPYHKFMAGEWLKYLVGAREAKLPAAE